MTKEGILNYYKDAISPREYNKLENWLEARNRRFLFFKNKTFNIDIKMSGSELVFDESRIESIWVKLL